MFDAAADSSWLAAHARAHGDPNNTLPPLFMPEDTFTGEAEQGTAAFRLERLVQADLLREILGNPYRPIPFDPAWPTPTVISLAQAAYQERLLPTGHLDPARLAILADALEEAGCPEQSILDHLRGPGPHVPGCWPVDLVLAKG
jgi:hypothetical protein